MDTALPTRTAQRAAVIAVTSATVIVAFKLVAAAISGSIAVLAEALQSTLDVAMSLSALWAIRIGSKPADEDHPFGHGKAEVLLSAFQMVMVVVTALVISWQAALRLHEPREVQPLWGMAAMGYSIAANAGMIVYLRRIARQTGSTALLGEASHLIGDSLACAGVLAGLAAYALTGWSPIDPLLAIGFTLLGAFFAVRQLRSLVHALMDGALPPHELELIATTLERHPESRGFHNVRTRSIGSRRDVNLHVLLDDDLSFVRAHEIAEHIESELGRALGSAVVTVHYEPYEAEMEHRRTVHGDGPARPPSGTIPS
ncbi:MAG: cation transporter [Armatimonadetes bacterium]|nr:cation transporter [Armatimonadota bacterium]